MALWTILTFRWPRLAEYLESYPEMIKHFLDPAGIEEVPEDLRKLFLDQNVRGVVEGKSIGTSLDEKTIKELLELRTSHSKASTVV